MVYRSSKGDDGVRGSSRPESPRPLNAFRNDGSFLEMFKKMQEEAAQAANSTAATTTGTTTTSKVKSEIGKEGAEEASADYSSPKVPSSRPTGTSSSSSTIPPTIASARHPFVGKRRGGRVLPTGRVKKAKVETGTDEPTPKDAWSVYLAEVKRYKETTCEEDGKTRPLVK